MTPPVCPKHGPMILYTITQGEGREEIYLGRFWGCVNDDRSKPDYCDECADYDGPEPERKPVQMSFVEC